MLFYCVTRWLKLPRHTRRPRPSRRRGRPQLEALEIRSVPAVITVTTAADDLTPNDGSVSLREAITAINAGSNLGDPDIIAQNPGAFGSNDTIKFNIPGAGVPTIKPSIALPAVSKSLTIDGYTQPGAAVNTASSSDNAQLKIVLDGSLLHNNENGLLLTAGGATVRGLVIENFPGEGIYLNNAGGDTVTGNFIGTDVSGKVAAGNAGGVFASNAGLNNLGGPALGDRNVISGNNGGGIFLFSDGNTVQNNYVGADASALAALHNAFGIEVHGSNNLIGGGSPGEGNIIAGNLDDGCFISLPSSAFNQVDGNQITSNHGNGVGIYNGAHDNIFGTSAPGAAANVISSNANDGVHLDGGTGNVVGIGNSIFSNGGLGIHLLNNANNGQAAPGLMFAVVSGGQITVAGTLHSTPNAAFTILFWHNPLSDPTEGEFFLGSVIVTTDASGDAAFTTHFNTALAPGDAVTATATGSSGTSQFSAPIAVSQGAASQAPAITSATNTTFIEGIASTFTVTTTGSPTASLSENGSLPGGVKFIDNGNGTATLIGTPIVAGQFAFTITATNATPPDAKQSFTLTVLTPQQLTPQQRFVQALYLDDLGRAGDLSNPHDAGYWVSLLTNGTLDQKAVAAGVVHSHEAQTHVVTGWYQTYLGRQPVKGEEQFWVLQLAEGQTEEQVLSGILGSDEFFSRAQSLVGSGTAQQRFVQCLYQRMLNRTGSAAELAFWVNQMPQFGRQGVAQGFQGATEYRRDVVTGDYNTLLHRSGTAVEVNYWVFSNLDVASIRIGFEASPEFFIKG
jgi:CSLREA domain-containing protein